ncbi:uncharacterized protein M6B38_258810 [Iris pallida]|uniref:Secreted protein n=1 Tax=Iris pallida TaxID=29817 RepID=A0AAX6IEX8_IRIPA|nr:uncharacterized protein M6B38_258810 [Iris pallida]
MSLVALSLILFAMSRANCFVSGDRSPKEASAVTSPAPVVLLLALPSISDLSLSFTSSRKSSMLPSFSSASGERGGQLPSAPGFRITILVGEEEEEEGLSCFFREFVTVDCLPIRTPCPDSLAIET